VRHHDKSRTGRRLIALRQLRRFLSVPAFAKNKKEGTEQ
jgi:hypothetical protein